MRKYAIVGQDLKNVAVNFSIIKHNEFKNTLKEDRRDIGVEELDFDVI